MADNQTPTAPATTGKLNLTPIQALDILIQAVNLAQQKGGVYTLKEASLLYEAVEVFAVQQQNAQAANQTPGQGTPVATTPAPVVTSPPADAPVASN